MGYEVIKINDNTWRIEDEFVRFFFLTGTKEALLIDCGVTVQNAKEIVAELSDLPVKLLVTHADGDHLGSKKEFDTFYMNPAEKGNFERVRTFSGESLTGDFIPVVEGDVIDLGDRPLEIIEMPGHTPGSIAILDVNARVLYSGDSVQDGEIYMFGEFRNVNNFVKSLGHLGEYKERFDEIYPSHGTIPVSPSLIDEILTATEAVIAGNGSGKEKDMFGAKITAFDLGVATLLMP